MDTEALGNLIRSTFGKEAAEFRPSAIYNPRLDRIDVIVRNTSYTELSAPALVLFLLGDNCEKGHAGFVIDCARILAEREGLIGEDGTVALDALIDAAERTSLAAPDDCAIARGLLSAHVIRTVKL